MIDRQKNSTNHITPPWRSKNWFYCVIENGVADVCRIYIGSAERRRCHISSLHVPHGERPAVLLPHGRFSID